MPAAGVLSRPTSTLIADLDSPVLDEYFTSFSRNQFSITASLFAPDGQLIPPFESAVVGQAAIQGYLEDEAEGMRALPASGWKEDLPHGYVRIRIQGRAENAFFGVQVEWIFVLNSHDEIEVLEVKLLASLEELLPLQGLRSRSHAHA